MPTILPPDEHLTAGLIAVQKHIDYHEGELAALRGLRRQYKDALGIVTSDRIETYGRVGTDPETGLREYYEATEAAPIPVVQPTFDEVVSTMSGRVAVQ